MREIQQLCSCAGIGWVLLLLCQLIESKAPNPKKVQEHPKSKERPRVSKSKRKTSIIQDPKKDQEYPKSEEEPAALISTNRRVFKIHYHDPIPSERPVKFVPIDDLNQESSESYKKIKVPVYAPGFFMPLLLGKRKLSVYPGLLYLNGSQVGHIQLQRIFIHHDEISQQAIAQAAK